MASGSQMSPRFLEVVRNLVVTYKGTAGDGVSVADVAKIARIEPITLISSSLSGQKELYNILHGVLNIYAAYYMQAVHILSAQLADVRILKILDKVNPDRDMRTVLTSGYHALESNLPGELRKNISTLTLENAKWKLPSINSGIATETIFDEDDDSVLTSSIQKLDTFEKLGSAVGKVLEVKFNVQDSNDKRSKPSEVAIPVVVKLDNMVIPSEVISNIMSSNKDSITIGSRFKDALSGRIDFIKDFILCSDLIKQQKKTMMRDPTGAYTTLLKRINNSRVFSALTGNISLAGVSAIVCISEQEEGMLRREFGGGMENANVRKMVFDNIQSMMVVVIDSEWERVSMYIRDMNGFSQNSFSSFKNSTDNNNDVMMDMFKQMTLNQSPSF